MWVRTRTPGPRAARAHGVGRRKDATEGIGQTDESKQQDSGTGQCDKSKKYMDNLGLID